MHPLAAAELQRHADGDVSGVAFRASAGFVHRTWARTFWSFPELYIQPQSEAEIEKVVGLARRCRRRIVTTGCAHSPSDLTCTSSWLLNLDAFGRILAIDTRSHLVTVQSGIRLSALCAELERHGLSMPNLGSINEQSLAGAISTGTHGSSAVHGLLSEAITELRITLADGTTRTCSPTVDPDLFRAAVLSLGAVGIITEITMRVVPAFNLRWHQTVDTDSKVFEAWGDALWKQAEFSRVWWLPHTRRAVVWAAEKTDEPAVEPVKSYYDGALGYHIYHNLLYLSRWVPRILPWIEWFTSGMQFGFANGSKATAVQRSHDALLLNCLYSQFVNEWAIPLDKGPEVLRRMSTWLNHLTPDDPDYWEPNIPFSADGLYVHAPMEVRISDTTVTSSPRPFLDPTTPSGPTLYLNALMYRPYMLDPPGTTRYYEAFEWLMREMGGRPHWAKNFEASRPHLEAAYGKDLDEFRRVRDAADPEGMFVGPWHRARIMAEGPKLALEEVETLPREKARGGGLVTRGTV